MTRLKPPAPPAVLVRADITDEEHVQRLVQQVEADLGPVDILVPNATPAQPQKPIEAYDWDVYQEMIDFFIKSPYLLSRACLPHMKRQRWGPHHKHHQRGVFARGGAVHSLCRGQRWASGVLA